MSSTEEQEATTFYQTEDSAIPNALISTNEQKAATFSSSESSIILNTPKPTNEQEAYHCNEDNIIRNALDSIDEQKATTFSQNESSIIQNSPTNKQEIATSHYSEINITQNALKSINEQKAAKLLSSSTSQLNRFDKANSAIDNKENESTFSNIMKLISTFPKSDINFNTISHTNDTFNENLQSDSILALNPLKRSKALANFKDVDDSTVPYVLQKKQKQEDKKTND